MISSNESFENVKMRPRNSLSVLTFGNTISGYNMFGGVWEVKLRKVDEM